MNQDTLIPSATVVELARIIAEQSVQIRQLEQMNAMLTKKLAEQKLQE